MAEPKARRETKKVGYPRRGDIYLVNFDPSIGTEIRKPPQGRLGPPNYRELANVRLSQAPLCGRVQKTRPALVIQNDIANRYSPITIVAAITSKFEEPPYPAEVVLEPEESGLPLRSSALLNQIRSVDRQRLVKYIGRASASTVRRVER